MRAAFSSEAEVYEFLGGVFRHGLDDPELVAKLESTGIVLRITYTEPDAVITVAMPARSCTKAQAPGRP